MMTMMKRSVKATRMLIMLLRRSNSAIPRPPMHYVYVAEAASSFTWPSSSSSPPTTACWWYIVVIGELPSLEHRPPISTGCGVVVVAPSLWLCHPPHHPLLLLYCPCLPECPDGRLVIILLLSIFRIGSHESFSLFWVHVGIGPPPLSLTFCKLNQTLFTDGHAQLLGDIFTSSRTCLCTRILLLLLHFYYLVVVVCEGGPAA